MSSKTKKTIGKFFCATFFSVALLGAYPLLASAAWAVTGDSSGNIGVGVGSSNGAIAAATGYGYGYGGFSINNSFGLPSGSILGILTNALYWLLMVFGILGVFGFVLSGVFYLLAGADEGNAKKGKAGMTASIIGIIVGLSGFIVMQAVANLLSGTNNKF